MALINRASLPEEFYDITSSMLLVQPEPQYLHAVLFKMAMASAMKVQFGALGMPIPNRPIASSGAAYSSAEADRQLMLANVDSVYSKVMEVVPEFDKMPGHTVRINRPKYGSGGFTLASREVASGASIGTTAIDLSSEQVTLTIKRYAGPYDSVNSAVAPFAVDKFDAGRSLHSVAQMVGKHMQRDFDKWLDAVMVTLGNTGSTATLYPAGFTADNDSTVAGDMPADADILFRASESMKLANIPRFANGRYMAIVSPTFSRQLKADPQFAKYSQYTPEKNPLYQSYLATCGDIDIFESTTLTGTANGSSVTVYKSQVFGPGFFGAGIGRLPEVMPNSSDNYGETALVIWLAYMAFGVLDSRFGLSLRTS